MWSAVEPGKINVGNPRIPVFWMALSGLPPVKPFKYAAEPFIRKCWRVWNDDDE
jgi:hypothetical protein